jgi:alpha-amylase/alpha-mannosidase (GH57 family)
MTKKYICLHGHFYQPPRENPWLNFVEIQDSAYPYHDWNHRINAECYARNGASRILDEQGRIQHIINNYSMMSFNMGPTLLAWMESEAPETYKDILQADKDSRERFSGHGSALAQAYNHMIMPLANPRDQETQVIWGIEDFKSRFGRFPEGMWCGETAINTDTLEVMAKHGIKFTILSPYQAKRTRKIGEKKWMDATDAKVDPRKAYVCNLPSGNSIYLFFYDGPASQGVAFEGLLENGGKFANRLMDIFSDEDEVQLANIATDGESYGHHHRYGEMALSYCLDWLDKRDDVELTVYGEFLEKFPVEYEAEIIENSSWSCYHGVERWRSNCGCNTGGNQGWHQKWREPLRGAFDWVREKLIPLYEREMQGFSDDPWRVRNRYIQVVLDRSKENIQKFLRNNIEKELTEDDTVKILRLLEMQYNSMLMYTSCGWFFDEVTGIESMQDIFYATRALQLAEKATGENYEGEFEALLEKAPSNDKKFGTAAEAFRQVVKPMKVDMLRVGAHYAVASLFKDFPEEYDLYNFVAKTQSRKYYEAGKYKLLVGRTIFQSDYTFTKVDIAYAVLHLGEHQLYGGVREYLGKDAYQKLSEEIVESFHKSDIYEIFNIMDKNFGSHKYSFWHLFRDEQRAIMELVLDSTLKNTEGMIAQMYEDNYHLLQVFKEINMKVPKHLKTTIDMAINARLMNQLEGEDFDIEDFRRLLEAAMRVDAELDLVSLNFTTDEKVNNLMRQLRENLYDDQLLTTVLDLIKLINTCNIKPEYWEAQNIAFSIKNHELENLIAENDGTSSDAENRLRAYKKLFENLNINV